MVRPGINRRQLRSSISRQLGPKLRRDAVKKINSSIERARALMLAEFDASLITKEIKGGSGMNNISGTLGGIGNLFSFIGFDDGDRPILAVRRLLENSMRVVSVRKASGGELAFDVVIDLPSKEDIAASSPVPWAAARSWVIGIEQGLSGLGQFFVKPGAGRSGGGIQIGGTIRSGRFRNKKYISAILNHLQSNLMQFLKS